MRYLLILDLRVTHGLHPRGLELSMFAMRIWRCINICIYIYIFI
jgi:hypothetical protein